MSAARMTDFPLWHFACRIYNYLEDGNWLRREPSLLCPPDDEGFCLLPLAWLSSRRRGRCWTICQLEFKCRAAPGPAAMAAAALRVLLSGNSPHRGRCLLFASQFLLYPGGQMVAELWGGGLALQGNLPFCMAW